MKRIGLLFTLCMVLMFASRVEADPIPTDGTWQQFIFTSLGDTAAVTGCDESSCLPNPANTAFAGAPPWTFTVPLGGVFNLVGTGSGDEFSVLLTLLGNLLATPTSALTSPDFVSFCSDPIDCLADPDNFSRASIALEAGSYSLEIAATASAFGTGFGFFQVEATQVPVPSTLLLLMGGLCALWTTRSLRSRRRW